MCGHRFESPAEPFVFLIIFLLLFRIKIRVGLVLVLIIFFDNILPGLHVD